MTTWYVRPDTTHNVTRDGTGYETAWGGWSEITWGVGGVVGGDTLYVCGAHAYSDASKTVGAHGGTNEATRCTIRGDYSADPGSFTFTGARYLENYRNWTTIRDLSFTSGTSTGLFISGGTDCVYTENTFYCTTSVPLSIYGSASHSRLTISNNRFSGTANNDGSGGFIGWFVTTTGITVTLTDIAITDNIFEDCYSGRSIIHLRTESDTNVASVMTGITISGNQFRRCNGVLIEAFHGHTTASIGGTLDVFGNTAEDCLECTAGGGIGGFSSLAGFRSARVYENVAKNIQGAAGFCNVFYGSFEIYNNVADGLTVTTIDANGLLFDHGAVNCKAYSNVFRNVTGKAGVFNSGVGIMVLDATDIHCFGNVIENCLCGVLLGTAASGQSCVISNNTFANIEDYGIYIGASADLANCTVKNNIFVGDGYSVYDLTATAWSNENYNCFYGFASGTSNHTLGAQSITTDPILDASYRPGAASPCLNAGTLIDGVVLKDFYGKDITASPDIGAMQVYAARSAVASRSAITRSAITRGIAGDRAPYG